MESECNCPACLKTFDTTNKLPCGHVFCGECVSKVEKLSQKMSTNPSCLVCRAEFTAASEEKPHPNSEYHDKLVSRIDPKKKKECNDCGGEPNMFCKDNCGFLCQDCHDKYHSKRRQTAGHKVVGMHEAGSTSGVNPRECILHNSPITSICNQCWPVAEMCFQCGFEDSTANKSHEFIKVDKIEYGIIKEGELIDALESRITEVAEKKAKAENKLKQISQEKEDQQAMIDKFHESIVEKALQLKAKLTEAVQVQFKPKSDAVESLRQRIETAENIMVHSISMLKESKEIYEREQVVAKLFKTSIYAKKVIGLEIENISEATSEDACAMFSVDGDVLIDETGAQLLGKSSKKIEAEMEELRKENVEWKRRVDEKENEMKHLLEKANALERELVSFHEEKERLRKEKEEKERKEKLGLGFFQRDWRFNIRNYKYDNKIGTYGDGNEQFHNPCGIAVHPKTGHIYVAGNGQHRIQIFDENMKYMNAFGSRGGGSGQFNNPLGISVSLKGHIAVCEWSGTRVQVFDEKHAVVAFIEAGCKKSAQCAHVAGFDGFSDPRDVCFDAEGNLYVTNKGKNRVDKFNASFEFERSIAHTFPGGLCCTSKNQICVVSYAGDSIRIYNTDGSNARNLGIQKVSSYAFLSEGPNNTILVSDYGNHRIFVYDMEPSNLVHTFGSSSSPADGQFSGPMGICFGLNQKLYVSEYNSHRIQLFSA